MLDHAAKAYGYSLRNDKPLHQLPKTTKGSLSKSSLLLASRFRALVLLGAAAAICAPVIPHITQPGVASTQQSEKEKPAACLPPMLPPQLLPILLLHLGNGPAGNPLGNSTWDLDTDSGVSQLLASIGRQLVVVPANRHGLMPALRLQREVSRLGVLDVPLLVSDTAQLCSHVKVPCAYTTQCTERRGTFARVLCAKLFALARLFASGADVFVIDSDLTVLSAEPFRLWQGPLVNASIICQKDEPFINSGMIRIQHVSPTADVTVAWLLEEWLHRVRLLSNVTGHCGGCDQSILNELFIGTRFG